MPSSLFGEEIWKVLLSNCVLIPGPPLLSTPPGPGLPTGDPVPISREGPCTPTFPLGGRHWRMLSLGLADHTSCDGQAFPGWRWHLKVLTGWSVSSGASTTTSGGRELQDRGDICTLTADSRGYTAETNTILQSNYPPIKKKF